MTRSQISIKLDSDLLDRIDDLASDVGVTRTAIIEKCLENELPNQEALYRSMENPVIRFLHKQLTRPEVLAAMVKIADGTIDPEEIRSIAHKAQRQIEVGERLQAERKQFKKSEGGV